MNFPEEHENVYVYTQHEGIKIAYVEYSEGVPTWFEALVFNPMEDGEVVAWKDGELSLDMHKWENVS